MTHFTAYKELFKRSHTWQLLEKYIDNYALPSPKKIDFRTMAEAQEAFEHIFEVLEQDLRLGEQTVTAKECTEQGCEFVLKNAVYYLCANKNEDAKNLIATKAIITDFNLLTLFEGV